MIADRYLERRFREGYIVGFKEGFKKGNYILFYPLAPNPNTAYPFPCHSSHRPSL